jgi:eukaryotic-like serine/threonine-protein kinase
MTLDAGTRLGPYEIFSPLGAGGMGEVYRARDTRLDRIVAVKVLPGHLSSNPEIRQRFEREARAASSLNHPHICTLYDIGHQDGIDYLVMEFIEGDTLANRLAKGALPLDQALRYAIQIADALDKAHRAGIVHRDLKPGNIMLGKSGAKLLDFGLAKLQNSESELFSSFTSLPTERHSLTGEGTILGTFQYMAPEQLEGKVADHRTDIFGFGAVVYEMATGRKAFTGKSQASLIGAILHTEPTPISTISPMTPPALDRTVRTCLAKDPDDRWQTAHDVMLQLKWIAEGGSQPGVPPPLLALSRRRERLSWIAAIVILLLGLLAALPFVIAHLRHGPVAERVMKLSVTLPEKSTMPPAPSLALSPDGRRLAFVASLENKVRLWVRSLDSLSAQALSGTDGVTSASPFWSPDSRFIAFFADGKLKKIDTSGGSPQTLCNAPDGRGGTWSRDGVILFAPGSTGGLFKVSEKGGEPVPATTLDKSRSEISHRFPYFLPDGRHFLYLARGNQNDSRGIYVGLLDSNETKQLLPSALSAAYAPPGFLLFSRNETLMAQAFDADRLELSGEPFPLAEQVGFNVGFGRSSFSVSENGVLVFSRGGNSSQNELIWLDRAGKQIGQLGAAALGFTLCLSPDEKRVAVDRVDAQTGTSDIWLFDLSRGIPARFTTDPAPDWYPLWSPDGSRIVFTSGREGIPNIFQRNASGVGAEEVLLRSDENKVPDDWSSDGKFIVFESLNSKTKLDLWLLPMTGDRQPFPFLQTEFNEQQAQFSPTGKWIAYTSDESGSPEVYVQTFPASGGKWLISTGGGCQPRWRRDGKELFYIAPDKKLMAVELKTGSALEAAVPKPLFETRVFLLTTFRNHYVVTGDGQRFLINSRVEETIATPITVVLDWTAELKR